MDLICDETIKMLYGQVVKMIHAFNPNSEIEKRSLCGKGYGHRD
jgi:hypothetical protein